MPEIPRDTIAAIHDRLHSVITGQTPLELSPEERNALHLQCGVLCWVLSHENNPAFQINMLSLLVSMHHEGVAMVVDQALGEIERAHLRLAGERFVIFRGSGDEKAIQCLTCGRTSWNPDDVQNKYCGHCKVFHLDEMEKELAELKAQLGVE